MFEDEEFLDSRVFQPLHKIVLGMFSVDLDQYLDIGANIDAIDADGRTALSWAAARGDLTTVRSLLRHDADPNIPSNWGQRPLHFAVQNKRDSLMPIMEELVEHGADVNAIDYWNRTPIHYASGNHASIAPLELLVDEGIALDIRDRRLRTALGYAARLGSFAHSEYLLRMGSNAHIPDEFNVLPLFDAVKNNYHEILEVLLPTSDPSQPRPFGSTLLHWVARYADRTTLDRILEAPLLSLFDGSEMGLVDHDKLTPQEVFDRRFPNKTGVEELQSQIQDLFDRIADLSQSNTDTSDVVA